MNFDKNMKEKNSKLRWQNKHLSILTCVVEAYSKPFSFFTFVEGFKCIFLPHYYFHRLVSFMSYISVNLALRNSKVLKLYPCGILKDWKRNYSAHFGLLKGSYWFLPRKGSSRSLDDNSISWLSSFWKLNVLAAQELTN